MTITREDLEILNAAYGRATDWECIEALAGSRNKLSDLEKRIAELEAENSKLRNSREYLIENHRLGERVKQLEEEWQKWADRGKHDHHDKDCLCVYCCARRVLGITAVGDLG